MEKTKTYSFYADRKFKEKFERLGKVLGVENPLQHTAEIFEQALDIAVDLTLDDQYDRLVNMKTFSSSEFKAKCLAILDEVARTGEPVTILKRGKPVAQLVPPVPRGKGYPQEEIIGTVHIMGDIVEPPLPTEVWEAERQKR